MDIFEGIGKATFEDYVNTLNYTDGLAMCMYDHETEFAAVTSKYSSPVTIGHQLLHRAYDADFSERFPATKAFSLKWKKALDAVLGSRSFSVHKVNPIYDEDPHK